MANAPKRLRRRNALDRRGVAGLTKEAFTSRKLGWLRQVMQDKSLPPSALSVAVAMACDFLSFKHGGVAYMTQQTLAAIAKIGRPAASAALNAMARRGHIEKLGFDGTTQAYVMRLAEKCEASDENNDNFDTYNGALSPNDDNEEHGALSPPDDTALSPPGDTETRERDTRERETREESSPSARIAREGESAPQDHQKSEDLFGKSAAAEESKGNRKDGGKARSSRPKSMETEPEGFAAFYEAYGYKVGRKDAARAFAKAIRKTPPAVIMRAIPAFHAANPDRRYWPHPATWLNGERWKDEHQAPARASPASGPSEVSDRTWIMMMHQFREIGIWRWDNLSPEPGAAGCKVPAHILAEFGIGPDGRAA